MSQFVYWIMNFRIKIPQSGSDCLQFTVLESCLKCVYWIKIYEVLGKVTFFDEMHNLIVLLTFIFDAQHPFLAYVSRVLTQSVSNFA